jgi:DNA recombination protein RmuC
MEILLLLVGLALGVALGALAGLLWARTRPAGAETFAALERRAADDALLRDGLDRLGDQMRDLEHNRATWQGQLRQQVEDVRLSAEGLRRETAALGTALRKPQVRGRWGEMQLRRAVELAGLVDRCDFTEQAHAVHDGAALRPDLVVHLAGSRNVVVDSKVALDAFLDATEADDPDEQAHHLARHARQVRQHIDALSSKRYWRAVEHTPEFVVLFLPGEAFLSAALDGDRDLVEYAARKQVVLATPTTLIALLRTVAQGWAHEALAERAEEIHRLGRELHERIGTLSGHFDRLGRSLGSAVASYNSAVGSLEGRVLVSARRFTELGAGDGDLVGPRQVESGTRALGADELATLAGELHAADPPAGEPALDLAPAADELSGSARRTRGA